MKNFSIAIDGPAGAGKSTVAKAVAKQLGAVYLDTGAMYRTMGLYMQRQQISGEANISAACAVPKLEIRFMDGNQHMFLDGEDVTEAIRSPEASMLASRVSAVPAVRERLVEVQRNFAEGNRVVMDGRDIGTHVLPNATLKIFLTASCEVRALRRHKELLSKGREESFDKVLADIVERDFADSNRAVSPLRQAEDALRVDTSDMTQEQVIDEIVRLAQKAVQEA